MLKVLITGANRGLGLELVKLFLKAGYTVAAGTRVNSNIDELYKLQEEYCQYLRIIILDMEMEKTLAGGASLLKNEFGELDIIINNAGVLIGREKRFDELELDELITSFQINTFGPMMLIKHFSKMIKKNQKSMIINITSESANDMDGGDFPYSMSKAALNMYSAKLNNYLKDAKIRVLTIHPGWIRTDMGGQNAPGNPETTAQNIFDIAEGRLKVDDKKVFIDHRGKRMD